MGRAPRPAPKPPRGHQPADFVLREEPTHDVTACGRGCPDHHWRRWRGLQWELATTIHTPEEWAQLARSRKKVPVDSGRLVKAERPPVGLLIALLVTLAAGGMVTFVSAFRTSAPTPPVDLTTHQRLVEELQQTRHEIAIMGLEIQRLEHRTRGLKR